MESALGEGGTRLMCSVGKDVMGMDQFGNPDGRLVVNADVPICALQITVLGPHPPLRSFRQPQAWQYARTLPCSSRCTRLRTYTEIVAQMRCPVCSGPMLVLERMTSSQLYFRSGLLLLNLPRNAVDSS
jgi:hypothetical protein